jgi:WXG100 family type VII secretion target
MTGTPGYRVDLAHLDDVTARIAGLHGFVSDTLAGLDRRVAAVRAGWSGAAADRYAQAHTDWAAAAAEMAAGIDAMRAAAAAAHTAYTDAAAANVRRTRH